MYAVRHTEDSYEFIRTCDAVTDITLTDPPYTEHVHRNLCSGSLVGKKSVPKYELEYPARRAPSDWLPDLLRISRRWVGVFCAIEDFGRFQDTLPENYVRGGVWYKKNAMGQLTADRPATAYEGIAFLHPTDVKKSWNGKGSYGIWSANGTRGKKGRHPNEKPLDLCLKLVSLFSDRGEVVFDPFCGSGAIGEAALLLGRSYVGLDNSEAWVASSNARLSRVAVGSVSDEEALKLCRMNGGDHERSDSTS